MTKMIRVITCGLLLLLIVATPSLYAQDAFWRAWEMFKKDPCFRTANISISIYNIDSGKEIVGYQSTRSMVPASTLKSITTGAALGILGPDFTFQTQIKYTGQIGADGTLTGDIIIVGGGDPTLGFKRGNLSERYDKEMAIWANAIRDAGIRSINGRIIADPSIFESGTVSPKWIYEDIGNYYGAGASGLNIHENKYNLVFKSGNKAGDPTHITATIPELKGVTFNNEVITGAPNSGDQAYIFCAPYSEYIFVRGSVPAKQSEFYINGAIPDPPKFAALSLHDKLIQMGINVSSGATTIYLAGMHYSDPQATTIHTTRSRPLSEIAKMGMHNSINIYMECMLKMMGKVKYNSGTEEAGIRAVRDFYAARRVDLTGLFMEDGCGLSPVNGISTRTYTQALAALTKEPWFPEYYATLSPMGGKGEIVAKSGYITRARGFVGYTKNKCGDRLAFAIIVNNYNCDKSAAKTKLIGVMTNIPLMEHY